MSTYDENHVITKIVAIKLNFVTKLGYSTPVFHDKQTKKVMIQYITFHALEILVTKMRNNE